MIVASGTFTIVWPVLAMAVDVGPVVGQVPAPGADTFPALPGASTRPGGGVPGDPGDVGKTGPKCSPARVSGDATAFRRFALTHRRAA